MKTITINGTEYKIKQTIRAIFLWEQITGRVFEIKNTMDNYVYFYSILLACNPDFMMWDDFLNAIDDDPNILLELGEKLNESRQMEDLLNPEDDEKENDGEKKKE